MPIVTRSLDEGISIDEEMPESTKMEKRKEIQIKNDKSVQVQWDEIPARRKNEKRGKSWVGQGRAPGREPTADGSALQCQIGSRVETQHPAYLPLTT